MDLFCYGTLRCAEVFEAVTGYARKGVEAVLDGYAAYRFVGRNYPGLVPDAGRQVSGVLYTRLDREIVTRLDRYEGDEYRKLRVRVRLADGRLRPAWVYLCRHPLRHRLSRESWDYQLFVDKELDDYLRRLR